MVLLLTDDTNALSLLDYSRIIFWLSYFLLFEEVFDELLTDLALHFL